jgi:hypothetical protein
MEAADVVVVVVPTSSITVLLSSACRSFSYHCQDENTYTTLVIDSVIVGVETAMILEYVTVHVPGLAEIVCRMKSEQNELAAAPFLLKVETTGLQ